MRLRPVIRLTIQTLLVIVSGTIAARAQALETTLHAFSGVDGSTANAGLLLASDGSFYGTTHSGGATGQGTVFKITAAGAFTNIYNFSGADGSAPYGGLTWGSDGNLYGTTYSGGPDNQGTVFKLTTAGALTTLYSFAATDGAYPLAGLALGSDGNFYGTTSGGGTNNDGTVFKISPSGTFNTLYNFSGPDGSASYAALTLGNDGNFYGSTSNGGSNVYYGTIFKITPGGSLTTLYNFGFTDGSNPYAALTQGPDGNFYSTSWNGGANTRYGTVFKITPQGALTTLYSFSGPDGSGPEGPVTLASDGNLYGTTVAGGSHSLYGSVFKITTSGSLTTVYSFARTDASNPTAGLTVGSDGNFYGTAAGGGSSGYGTVFKLVVCLTCTTTTLSANANPSAFGAPVTFAATVAPMSGSGTPTGSIAFSDGSNALGSVAMTNGGASLTTSALAPGPHSITASYSGDATFQPSNGSLSESVTAGVSSTVIVSSINPSIYNQPITLSVQVTPAIATGSVTFTDGGTTLGVTTLLAGSASLPAAALSSGTHSILASYSGDSNFQPSSATLAQVVSQAGTTVNLMSSMNPVAFNQSFNLTATLAGQMGGSPTGTVTFSSGGTPIAAPVSVVSGQATLATTFALPGSYSIQAAYSGDPNYLASNTTLSEAVSPGVAAPILTTLYSFAGHDGSAPYGGLTLANDGNFYGATQTGGANSAGSIYKVTPAGTLTTLYSFAGPDGSSPSAALTIGADGNFYGVTSSGGSNAAGTVFRITPGGGTLTTLYNFAGPDGSSPSAALALGNDGNFYGTTSSGGINANGTVFQITPAGILITLYNFAGPDGASPTAALTLGSNGNFYGSTSSGGLNNDGTIFEINSSGALTTLYSFQGSDGSSPGGALTLSTDGNFYGTTSNGGANATFGTVFKITPVGSFTTLYSFAGPDGSDPNAALTLWMDGNLYGATTNGGENSSGTIYKITPAGSLTTLYNFAGTDGSDPTSPLTIGVDGNLYGTTTSGAANGDGSVFRIVVCPACTTTSVSSSGTPSAYGAPVSFTAAVAPMSGVGSPTGSITFTDGGNPLGSPPLTGNLATLNVSTLSAGQHSIAAAYSGDTNFQSSNGTFLQIVNRGAAATAVTSNSNPSTYDQPVTFTATVTPTAGVGAPTGTITFTDGSTTLGVVTLNAGSASYTAAALSAGTHAISAAYSGDANFQANTASLSQVVNLAATATKVVSSLNPSPYGQSVTFTASVAPAAGVGTPTGSVTFTDGSTTLGVVSLTAGAAPYTTLTLSAGTHPITASYSGDSNFAPGSATLSQLVNLASTTTAVSSSLNPSTYDQPITVAATVTPSTASGTVTFTSGGTTLGVAAIAGGVASISVPVLGAGTQTILAVYGGSPASQGSSGTLSQVVNHASTTVGVASSLNPAQVSQQVTFTATLTGQYGGKPTGSVTFLKNGVAIGSPVAVNAGVASLATTFTSTGAYQITAAYSGDTNFSGNSSGTLSEVVNAITVSTTTKLQSSGPTSLVGTPVLFTATVVPASGKIPNGEQVTFTSGSVALGTGVTVSNIATLKTTLLPAGVDSVTATYVGDTTYLKSTSPAIQQQVAKNTTTTTLSSSANPSSYGTPVIFTAKVTSAGPTPTGTVTFKNGTAAIGIGTVSAGVATFSALLQGGTQSITAVYSGDAFSTSTTSTAISQVVNPAVTTTALVSSLNPSTKGQAVTFTATITAGGVIPAGAVAFTFGSTTLGTIALTSGKAALTTSALPSGTDTITATFTGNVDFAKSSISLAQTVH